ncbi:hypothetical protein QIS99_01700 [Streptomyces sp. B-S-A8]|uniref:Regulatory protein n=1 Tax=Streptomyces solicavernae TaxID=3043614 RepID=A0ABT6RKI3_9ACTN|nr:hypothetical protein [Streptomyces sp. B-S-A8]MDI3384936.1 hypothetical protein [Streptomyces sp. B-S-A8]
MSDDHLTSSVQDRYAPQFAQELARNEQEQKELEARLGQLRDDHTALSGMLAALGHGTTAESEPAATTVTVADEARTAGDSLPRQRRPRKKPASTGTAAAKPKRTKKAAPKAGDQAQGATKAEEEAKAAAKPSANAKRSAKPSANAKRSTEPSANAKRSAKPSANPKATVRSAAKAKKNGTVRTPGGPTLQDVIAGLLGGHAPERRTVREIFDELKQKHPERASSTQSVRNALNGLLRKGAIEREEKQGAVWFGTPTADATATPADTATPAAAAGPADTATSAAAATPAAEPTEEKSKAAAEA